GGGSRAWPSQVTARGGGGGVWAGGVGSWSGRAGSGERIGGRRGGSGQQGTRVLREPGLFSVAPAVRGRRDGEDALAVPLDGCGESRGKKASRGREAPGGGLGAPLPGLTPPAPPGGPGGRRGPPPAFLAGGRA